MIPVSYQEPMQVLRYQNSQYYHAHPDFYDEWSIKQFNPEAGNRAITVLMYLSDVEEGGQTEFPKGIPAFSLDSEEARMLNVTKKCGEQQSMGFTLQPRKGSALVFHSTNVDGKYDDKSIHAGCTVLRGEKWSATKWIRQRFYTNNSKSDAVAEEQLYIDLKTYLPPTVLAVDEEKYFFRPKILKNHVSNDADQQSSP